MTALGQQQPLNIISGEWLVSGVKQPLTARFSLDPISVSAFTQSGHSDGWKIEVLSGCFRPLAVVQIQSNLFFKLVVDQASN